MNSKIIKSVVLCLGILTVSIYQIHSSSGGASTPKTGAPSESTCTSCHNTYSVQTSGTKYDKIKLSIPFTGGGYLPDSTYRVTISYRETNITRYGFQITALNQKNEAAGTFTNINSRVQTFSSTVAGATRYYAEHTGTGTSAVSGDSIAWTFEWKAPTSNMGDIKFYLALNVTNSSSGVTGDYVYNKSFTVSPSSLLPKAKVVLQSQACTGVSLNFSADSSSNATSYSWRFIGGAIPSTSTSKNPSVVFSSTGSKSAILETSNSKGKSKPDTLTFTVLTGASLPTINSNPVTPLCKGDTVALNITPANNHTYYWSNGVNGNQILVDTNGIFNVTAVRNNGCERKSNDVTVVTIPKPNFKVLYGFTGDTICSGEPLLVFTQNRNGYADSYSTVSKTGPYTRDSLYFVNIGNTSKNVQFWAKSKNGCTQGPISKTFVGIDTISGPIVSVKNKYIDRITFGWNKIPFATEYRYSLDSGKTWNNPIEGKLSDSTSIDLKSVTKKISFWLQARTSNYCGITQVSKIISGGLGCKDIFLNVIASNDSLCFGDSTQLTLSGLPNNNRWSIKFNGKTFKDSLFNLKPNQTNNYIFAAIDSTQIACGYYEKQIRIVVDSVEIPQLSFSKAKNEIICGGLMEIDIQINNSNSSNKRLTHIKSKLWDSTFVNFPKTVKYVKYDTLNYWNESSLINGCVSQSQEYFLQLQDSINTEFIVTWLDNFNYKIKRNTPSTIEKIRFYVYSDGIQIDTNILDSFTIDLQNEANKNIEVKLFVENSPCIDSNSYNFVASNLGNHKPKLSDLGIYPNPISNFNEIRISNDAQRKVKFLQIYSTEGKKIFQKIPVSESSINGISNSTELLKLENVVDGIYLIELLDKNGTRIKMEKIQKIGR
jgi:hypothetical protein